MADATGYDALTADQLGTELERRGLPKSGKKDELIRRLVADDEAAASAEGKGAGEGAADAGESSGDAGKAAADDSRGAAADADEPEADEREAAAEAGGDDETEGEHAGPAAGDESSAEPARDKPRRRLRRGAAETSTGASVERPASEQVRAAPRDAAGAVAVRARAKYVRSAPRKARLVMDHIRGKRVADARAILRHTPRAAATDIAKLLDSAVANAENNYELDPDELKIGRAFVDEGPTIKRYQPRAQGRATPIHKRTSHMTVVLTVAEPTAATASNRGRRRSAKRGERT